MGRKDSEPTRYRLLRIKPNTKDRFTNMAAKPDSVPNPTEATIQSLLGLVRRSDGKPDSPSRSKNKR